MHICCSLPAGSESEFTRAWLAHRTDGWQDKEWLLINMLSNAVSAHLSSECCPVTCWYEHFFHPTHLQLAKWRPVTKGVQMLHHKPKRWARQPERIPSERLPRHRALPSALSANPAAMEGPRASESPLPLLQKMRTRAVWPCPAYGYMSKAWASVQEFSPVNQIQTENNLKD